jgi:hypothetical protein
LILNVALDYAIRKVLENQVGLKLIGTYRLLVYADDPDDVNLLTDNIDYYHYGSTTLCWALAACSVS